MGVNVASTRPLLLILHNLRHISDHMIVGGSLFERITHLFLCQWHGIPLTNGLTVIIFVILICLRRQHALHLPLGNLVLLQLLIYDVRKVSLPRI